MSAWLARRAAAAQVLGIVLLLAGLVPVVLFVLTTLLPSADATAVLGLLPEVPGDWLSAAERWLRAHKVIWAPQAGLLYALPGLGVMLLGAAIARRQAPVLDAMQARRADARRRVQQYRGGGPERIEPTLGPAE